MSDAARAAEVAGKIELLHRWLDGRALRLRGIDWFAWMTAGGSNAVLLAAETGVAEVVVTKSGAWVVTDEIEAQRLADEELPEGLSVRATAWAHPAERESVIEELTRGREIMSDRPQRGEGSLPAGMVAAKRTMTPSEIERYQMVGLLASQAMTEAMQQADPDWAESDLAAAGAAALMQRGLEPALIMAAGERRMQLYRHPVTTADHLGLVAMMVFCARGHGLYANLTRFVSFGPLPAKLNELHLLVHEIEAEALKLSRPGVELRMVYNALAEAYASAGHSFAIREHHQGGTTGYLSREVIATPDTAEVIMEGTAVAWNPSLRGAKIEDTFLVTERGLVNLTTDPEWPKVKVAGLDRPLVLAR